MDLLKTKDTVQENILKQLKIMAFARHIGEVFVRNLSNGYLIIYEKGNFKYRWNEM